MCHACTDKRRQIDGRLFSCLWLGGFLAEHRRCGPQEQGDQICISKGLQGRGLSDFVLAKPGIHGQTVCADWLLFLYDSLHIRVEDKGEDLVRPVLQRQLNCRALS